MGDLADVLRLDATAQAELVRRGEVAPTELVEAAIARIEAVNPTINAVIHPRFEKARAEAAGRLPDGPFRGVPFVLKDLNCESAGDPAHQGMRVLRDAGHVATEDAWLTTRYRRAGFVIVGRTNTPELGLVPTTEPVAHGPTRNPWHVEHTPGGSSGGTAAAVGAGMVAVGHASDGGGSIRIPASMCGLVGLKVSRGRTTLGPQRDESGLSVHHVISRSVRDSAAVLDATQGPGPGDMAVAPPPTRPYLDEVGADPGRLRIGFMATSPVADLHPDCRDAVLATAKLLESLGHDLDEDHPQPLDEPDENAQKFMVRWTTNARYYLQVYGEQLGRTLTADDVEPATWLMSELASAFTAVDHAACLAAQARFTRAMAAWWAGGHDLLLTPTLGEPPPRLGELVATTDDPLTGMLRSRPLVPYTTHFNVTGQPAVSLPMHWNDAGLPIGVQLVAPYGREDVLIRVAAQLEAAHPWADRRPPV